MSNIEIVLVRNLIWFYTTPLGIVDPRGVIYFFSKILANKK
jgi:hypothetical protein